MQCIPKYLHTNLQYLLRISRISSCDHRAIKTGRDPSAIVRLARSKKQKWGTGIVETVPSQEFHVCLETYS